MLDTVPIPTIEPLGPGRSPRPDAVRRVLVPSRRAVVAIGVTLLVVLGIGAAWAAGLRVFVVESPSMGAAAPVGSLVVGRSGDDPVVGDLVTFHAPGAGATPYTHRIVAVSSTGFRTRGDINGAADPWTVAPSQVIARAQAVVPGVGWLLKAAPVLLVALVIAQLAGLFVRGPARRWSLRTAALAVGVAFISWTMRPFSGFVLLSSAAADEGMRATVVSTALLPIRVSAVGGGHADLVSGQVGHLLMPRGANGHVTMSAQLDLDPLGWVLIALVCLLPVIAVLAIGVPVEEAADAGA